LPDLNSLLEGSDQKIITATCKLMHAEHSGIALEDNEASTVLMEDDSSDDMPRTPTEPRQCAFPPFDCAFLWPYRTTVEREKASNRRTAETIEKVAMMPYLRTPTRVLLL
jgi:hypothetical protein